MADEIVGSFNGSSALAPAAFGAIGDPPQAVTAVLGLPTRPDGVPDGAITPAWDGTAVNSDGYGSALISVNGLAAGDAIVVKGSVTGANPKVLAVQDLGSITGAMAASITADGLYLVPAAGTLTYAKTGANGSAQVINMKLKR